MAKEVTSSVVEMDSLRPWIETAKYLSAWDLLRTAATNKLWRRVTEVEEVWLDLLERRSEGLITDEIRATSSSKRLYQALYSAPGLHYVTGSSLIHLPIPFRSPPIRETLTADTSLSKASFLIRLPDSSIFACGGDQSSSDFFDYGLGCTYRIYPLTLSVQQLEDLPAPRRYPCGLYFHGSVYIFGGSDYRTMLKSAVKYELASGKWRELSEMREARCSTTPCLYGGEIYLVGGGPATGAEAFHIKTERYRLLPISIGGQADSVTVVVDEELIVFTLKTVQIYALQDCRLVHSAPINSDNYVWSHTQPLLHQGEVWFYYWHRECLVHFNVSSRKFSSLPALSYAQMKSKAEEKRSICRSSLQ